MSLKTSILSENGSSGGHGNNRIVILDAGAQYGKVRPFLRFIKNYFQN